MPNDPNRTRIAIIALLALGVAIVQSVAEGAPDPIFAQAAAMFAIVALALYVAAVIVVAVIARRTGAVASPDVPGMEGTGLASTEGLEVPTMQGPGVAGMQRRDVATMQGHDAASLQGRDAPSMQGRDVQAPSKLDAPVVPTSEVPTALPGTAPASSDAAPVVATWPPFYLTYQDALQRLGFAASDHVLERPPATIVTVPHAVEPIVATLSRTVVAQRVDLVITLTAYPRNAGAATVVVTNDLATARLPSSDDQRAYYLASHDLGALHAALLRLRAAHTPAAPRLTEEAFHAAIARTRRGTLDAMIARGWLAADARDGMHAVRWKGALMMALGTVWPGNRIVAALVRLRTRRALAAAPAPSST